VRAHDIVTPYLAYVQGNLRFGKRRLRVVVDAGNGTGGVVAVPLFRSLGIDVVPLFVEMDGRFPNHHPDPTVEKNLEHLKAKVLETRADLGIAYDGDALDWWHRMSDTSGSVAKRQRAEVATWRRDNPLDSAQIIRIMRDNEQNGRRLTV